MAENSNPNLAICSLYPSSSAEEILSCHLPDGPLNLLGNRSPPFLHHRRFDSYRAAARATTFISKPYKRYSKKVLGQATIFNDSVQHPNCRHGRAQRRKLGGRNE